MWCWRRKEKIKWSEKVTNEQVFERIGEKRTILNNPTYKCRLDCDILRINNLHLVIIERQIIKMKGVGRRSTQLLDDVR